MRKLISVTTDTSHGTETLLPGLVSSALWECDTSLTLLLIGYLTSPPRYRGISLSTYWAWLRYGAAISATDPWLRLRPVWAELDPHQKTILADDFGIGFPCHFLMQHHGFEDFADTSYLLDTLFPGLISHAAKAKRGPSKTPDLIAIDSADRLHVLECKGTQSSREYLDVAMQRGIDQKNNLSNGSIFSSCMVGGIFIPQAHSDARPVLVFIDPSPDKSLKRLTELDPALIARTVRRQSFAKALSAAGLWTAAQSIDGEGVGEANVGFIRNMEDGELRFNGFNIDEDNVWRKIVEYRSLEGDMKQEEDRAGYVTRLTIDVPIDLVSTLKQAIRPDGRMQTEMIDAWLMNRLQSARTTTRRSLRSAEGKRPFHTRSISSGWRMEALDAHHDAASLTMSSGLSFHIERRRFT